MQRIRLAPTSTQADEWALVLTAAGIPNAVEPGAGGWSLLAPADDAVTAHAALAAYDAERAREIARAPVAREPYPWMSGVALALLVLWAFAMTGPAESGSAWVARGTAEAGRLIHGQPWRAVTALTLHVDVVHVASNAVAIAVLVPALVQRLGGGSALLWLVAAGALGNVLSALLHDPAHAAVGASTAIFGAVGALAALRLMPDAPAWSTRKRWTVPVVAVLLLAMLGTGRDADVIAHACGLLAGVAAGAAAGLTQRTRPGRVVQWLLGLLAALVVAGSWALALRGGA